MRPVQFDRGARKREYGEYKRFIWGGSGKGANEIGVWAKKFGRRFENVARNTILPSIGYVEIDDWSAYSNVFFVDFIATSPDEGRVLIDVTTKWAAHIPNKIALANSLRMRLFILHISPRDPKVYWLNEIEPVAKVSKIPMSIFHRLHEAMGSPFKNWPDEDYRERRGQGARKRWSV
jgi:hypothetical protein